MMKPIRCKVRRSSDIQFTIDAVLLSFVVVDHTIYGMVVLQTFDRGKVWQLDCCNIEVDDPTALYKGKYPI